MIHNRPRQTACVTYAKVVMTRIKTITSFSYSCVAASNHTAELKSIRSLFGTEKHDLAHRQANRQQNLGNYPETQPYRQKQTDKKSMHYLNSVSCT